VVRSTGNGRVAGTRRSVSGAENVTVTPVAFGSRVALSADGLAMAVVNGSLMSLYTRASKSGSVAWSLAGMSPRHLACSAWREP
jgi:hypothetical protein